MAAEDAGMLCNKYLALRLQDPQTEIEEWDSTFDNFLTKKYSLFFTKIKCQLFCYDVASSSFKCSPFPFQFRFKTKQMYFSEKDMYFVMSPNNASFVTIEG